MLANTILDILELLVANQSDEMIMFSLISLEVPQVSNIEGLKFCYSVELS